MASITNHGMMSAEARAPGSPVGASDGNPLKVSFSSQPRGVLIITNLTTGYSKTIKLSNVSSGETVYSTSDDAGYSFGQTFDISCSGKADTLYLSMVKFDGNGSSEISGVGGGDLFSGA